MTENLPLIYGLYFVAALAFSLIINRFFFPKLWVSGIPVKPLSAGVLHQNPHWEGYLFTFYFYSP